MSRGRLLLLVLCAAALVLASSLPGATYDRSVSFLLARQGADGGFAEAGRRSDAALTAWAALGLAAAGRRSQAAAEYLERAPVGGAAELALRALALRALGRPAADELARLEGHRRPDGRIGPLVNSTVWGVLALRAAGRQAGPTTVRYLLRRQAPSGGWPWAPGGAPDSNDTAAAIEALRAAGVSSRSRSIRRSLGFLTRLQNRDGGFALVPGRASDSQSTAWAVQALIAAGRRPPETAFRYLAARRRADGSYRYSARYATTPVWVTAQVVPALARKPFPLGA